MRADQMNQHKTMNMTHDAFDASLASNLSRFLPRIRGWQTMRSSAWIISIGERTVIVSKHRTRREKREEQKSREIRIKLFLICYLIQLNSHKFGTSYYLRYTGVL